MCAYFYCLHLYHVDSSNDLTYNGRFAFDGLRNVVLPTMSVRQIVHSPTANLPYQPLTKRAFIADLT